MPSAPSLARTASSFRVQVLGPFVLERNGVAVETARWQRRVVTLLKLLAIAPRQRRSRDEIVDLLWPETTPEAGAGNLRLVVHRLRLALADSESQSEPPSQSASPVLLEQGWARLNPVYSWESDLDEFERLARSDEIARLERAAALYRGEPLVEDAYEDWAAPVRDRIARKWREVCLRLAGFHQARGSHEDALIWLERLLEADPLDEEALRGALRALRELARGTEALRRFRQFERLLAEELDVPPDAETLTMVSELESELRQVVREPAPMNTHRAREVVPVTPSYPLRTIIPLLGRDTELEAITALLPGAETPSLNLVLIAAEAGVGKTRLLAEVAERARLANVLTLAGGCYEREGRLPYGPIHDALLDYVQTQPENILRAQLDGLLPDLVRIVPEVRAKAGDVTEAAEGEPASLRLRLFASVAQALDRIGHDRALLLILDDLHWGDDATIQLLHFLIRQRHLERALIVGAYRQEEVETGSPLSDLMVELGREEAPPVKRLTLRPLREADLARLLEQRLGGPCAGSLVHALYGRSEGNPFFALQMLRLLEEEGRLIRTEGGWDLAAGGGGTSLPPQVRDTVARRLRRLGVEEREALAQGAVLGREFAFPALEAMWERGESALFRALEAARDAYLLGETETGFAFRHPILREVVYSRLSAEHRRVLHERAGQALELTYGSVTERAAELAWHFLQGRDRRRALPYATVAADQAERAFAHAEAERHYRIALELAHQLGDRAAERQTLEKLGDVLKTVGRYDEALEVLERAADGYRTVHDLEGERRAVAYIGQVHYRRGTLEEGAARIQRALVSLDEDVPSYGLAVLYLALAILLFRSGRYEEQLEAAERAGALAQEIEDKRVLAEARLLRTYSLPWTGRQIDFKGALEEVIRLAEEIEDLTTLCRALCAVAETYSEEGKPDRATRSLERALEIAERLGDRSRLAFVTATLGFDCFWRGDWDRAGALFEQSLALYRELGATSDSMMPLVGLGAVKMARGDLRAGEEALEAHTAIAQETGDLRLIHYALPPLAELDILDGRPQDARRRLEHVIALPGMSANAVAAVLPVLAWTYLEFGDERRAEELAASAIAEATEEDNQMALVEALQVLGIIRSRQGRVQEACRAFEEGLELLQRMKLYPYLLARLLYHWGSMDIENAELMQARERLEEALGIFRRLGARPYIERTEQALAELE